MENLIKTTLLGLFFGTFGTTLGGIIGVTFKNTSNKFLSFILSLASGLMTSIICFDLIPEALEISNLSSMFWFKKNLILMLDLLKLLIVY